MLIRLFLPNNNTSNNSYFHTPELIKVVANYHVNKINNFQTVAKLDNFTIYDTSDHFLFHLNPHYKIYLIDYDNLCYNSFKINKISFIINKDKFYYYLTSKNKKIQLYKNIKTFHFIPYKNTKQKLINLQIKLNKLYDKFITVPISNISKAMILNKTSFIDWQNKNLFKESGLIHLLAISGLHFSIIISIILSLLYFLTPDMKTKSIIIIIISSLYIIIIGTKPSIVRAYLFVLFYFIGILLDKKLNKYTILNLCYFISLIINPENLFHIGFQLSFTATISIFIALDLLQPFNKIKNENIMNNFLYYPFSISIISFIISLFTIPIINYNFKVIYPMSILNNIIISIPATIFIASSFLFLSFSYIPFINKSFAALTILSGKLLIYLLEIFTQKPYQKIKIHLFNDHISIIIYYSILLTLIYLIKKISNIKANNLQEYVQVNKM